MEEMIEQLSNMPASELLGLLAVVIAAAVALAFIRQIRAVRELKKVRLQVEHRIRSHGQS